jgi:hypothetical protein
MEPSEAVLSRRTSLGRSAEASGSAESHSGRSHVRAATIDRLTSSPREEALVVDERSAVRPAQVVENKLMRMIKNASLPVSHLQMTGLLRSRQPAS